ncbi:MAG: sulfatase-like hydrolase/transferase [Acidobacteriota bacterium]
MIFRAEWRPIVACFSLSITLGCGAKDAARDAPTVPTSVGRLDSLLVVTIDTLRSDYVSCYNSEALPKTPHLDGLAARGARLDRVWAPIPLTTPAHASIFSGLYPPGHGVRNNARFRLPDDVQTLAEMLHANGSSTGAVVSSFVTSRQFGLAQGFDQFFDDLGNDASGGSRSQRPGNESVDLAIDWLRQHSDKPFFLWVHLYDPHTPYRPPPEYMQMARGNAYAGEVAFADAQLGRLLEALDRTGAASRTVVTALADHGEGLGTHGEKEHGFLLYEEVLHVPFVIAAPGRIAPGTVIAGPASTVDLVPTVLPLLGVQTPAGLQGVDLLAPNVDLAKHTIYAETLYPFEEFGWSALYALRDQDRKLIEAPTRELYDLSSDRREGKNLAAIDKTTTLAMAAALQAKASGLVNAERLATAAGFDGGNDPETIARLESLGYVAGGAAASSGGEAALPSVEGRNPREALDDLEAFDRAQDALQQGDLPFAIKLLTRLSKTDPDNPQFLMKLGLVQEQSKQFADADRTYKRLLDAHPTFLLGVRRYSSFLEERGRAKESRNLWIRLAGLLPGYVGIETRTARAEVAAGMISEAIQRMQSYTSAHPDDYEGWTQLGLAHAANKQDEPALAALKKALAIKPTAREALDGAIAVFKRAGQSDRSRALIDELLQRAPGDPVLMKARSQ